MEPRVSIVTLGVSDLKSSIAFYCKGLGWPRSRIGGDEVAFLRTGGVVISLFPKEDLTEDAGIPTNDGTGFSRFAFAHNVIEREEVDAVLDKASEAGATIVKEARDVFFGRSGYFADPDGFLWEVAWNPSFPMRDDGSIELPG